MELLSQILILFEFRIMLMNFRGAWWSSRMRYCWTSWFSCDFQGCFLQFFRQTMVTDLKNFMKYCLNCLLNSEGDIILRLFDASIEPQHLNEVIYFDYLDLEPARDVSAHLLVIHDRLSAYCDFFPTPTPTAHHTAVCFLDWFSRFGFSSVWVSNRGTHFLNQTVASFHRC